MSQSKIYIYIHIYTHLIKQYAPHSNDDGDVSWSGGVDPQVSVEAGNPLWTTTGVTAADTGTGSFSGWYSHNVAPRRSDDKLQFSIIGGFRAGAQTQEVLCTSCDTRMCTAPTRWIQLHEHGKLRAAALSLDIILTYYWSHFIFLT